MVDNYAKVKILLDLTMSTCTGVVEVDYELYSKKNVSLCYDHLRARPSTNMSSYLLKWWLNTYVISNKVQ